MTSPRRLGYKNGNDIGPIRLYHTYKLRWNVRYSNFHIPDSKGHGANMGPTWGRQDPCGPHVGPMSFAIWDSLVGCAVDGDMPSYPQIPDYFVAKID